MNATELHQSHEGADHFISRGAVVFLTRTPVRVYDFQCDSYSRSVFIFPLWGCSWAWLEGSSYGRPFGFACIHRSALVHGGDCRDDGWDR